jgi:hypothetical protein
MLLVKMLKFKKKTVFFKEQNFVKENQESFGIFEFSTWNRQNRIIIQSTCIKAALVLCIIVYGKCKHEICLEGAMTTFLQLFLLHEICKLVLFQSKEPFKFS